MDTNTAAVIATIANYPYQPAMVDHKDLRKVARHFGIKYTTKCETFDAVKAAIASAAQAATL